MTLPRHSWPDTHKVVFPLKTERTCANGCGLVKVTRHDGPMPWIEWWRPGADGALVKFQTGGPTPPCEASPATRQEARSGEAATGTSRESAAQEAA